MPWLVDEEAAALLLPRLVEEDGTVLLVPTLAEDAIPLLLCGLKDVEPVPLLAEAALLLPEMDDVDVEAPLVVDEDP